jgi:hypothetical protein
MNFIQHLECLTLPHLSLFDEGVSKVEKGHKQLVRAKNNLITSRTKSTGGLGNGGVMHLPTFIQGRNTPQRGSLFVTLMNGERNQRGNDED